MKYAIQHNITRIVMGHSKQTAWQELWKGSIANSLLKQIRGVDVFFVADRAEREENVFFLPGRAEMSGKLMPITD